MGKLKESEVCKVISQFEFESTDIFLEKVSTTEGKKFIVLDSSKSRKDFIETLRTIILKDSSFVKKHG